MTSPALTVRMRSPRTRKITGLAVSWNFPRYVNGSGGALGTGGGKGLGGGAGGGGGGATYHDLLWKASPGSAATTSRRSPARSSSPATAVRGASAIPVSAFPLSARASSTTATPLSSSG